MKKCAHCREQLSEYLDDMLKSEQKRHIDEHLSSCEQCRLVLAELKQTRKIVQNLEEVEPPPLFTQKIMHRIREDAEPKRTFLQRLFYPLHIKIPMEALATCLIVVLALFIYKNTGLDVKTIREPEETTVVSPQLQEQGSDEKTITALPGREKDNQPGASLKKGSPGEQKDMRAPSTPLESGFSGLTKDVLPTPATPPAEVRITKKDLEEAKNRHEAREALPKQAPVQEQRFSQDSAEKPSAATPPTTLKEQGSPAPERSATTNLQRPSAPGLSPGRAKTASISEKRHLFFTITTKNLEITSGETENLLRRFGAENISRVSYRPPLVTLSADLSGRKVEEFFNELKKLGPVMEKTALDSRQEEYVTVFIEITANP